MRHIPVRLLMVACSAASVPHTGKEEGEKCYYRVVKHWGKHSCLAWFNQTSSLKGISDSTSQHLLLVNVCELSDFL